MTWTRAMIRTTAIACAIVALGFAPVGMATAQDLGEDSDVSDVSEIEEPEASGSGVWSDVGAKTLDAAVLRPLGALSSAVGFGFFLASTPFLAPFEGIGDSWDAFVRTPVENTFERPLGDL